MPDYNLSSFPLICILLAFIIPIILSFNKNNSGKYSKTISKKDVHIADTSHKRNSPVIWK